MGGLKRLRFFASRSEIGLKSRVSGGRTSASRPAHPARNNAFPHPHRRSPISSERCLETYLQEINEVPLLTAEQEQDLGHRVQQGDMAAREHLVRANLRLVVSIAKLYSERGLPLQDLIAEGNIGLLKAAEKFDPEAGCRFSTYGSWWIKQAIRRSLSSSVQSVRVPGYMAELISKWRVVGRELSYRLGRSPSVEEVARELGIPPESWRLLKQTIQTTGSGAQLELMTGSQETVEDEKTYTPEETIQHADMLTRLRELLDSIDERQATILRLRYGLGESQEPMTLKDIGKVVGLTRERVRQIERETLARLSRVMEGH